MDRILRTFEAINAFVCGPLLPAAIIGLGVFLSFQTNFLQFRKFVFMIQSTLFKIFKRKNENEAESGISPIQAVCTALAGTIGVGSIVGVASAVTLGGPGALFWMWVSAFFGMIIKYSEILLSLAYRQKDKNAKFFGGPMYYMKKGLGLKFLPILFSVFGILSCFGIGNLAQSNAISLAMQSSFSIPKTTSSFFVMVLTALVILGGVKRIAAVNEALVPLMALLYVFGSLFVIFINRDQLSFAVSMVFREAFTFRSASSGIGGWNIYTAIRFGFSRGIFSNEAGLGSAPIAHAASTEKEPVKQALWGMFEVFFTTVLICTTTGFLILSSDLWQNPKSQGIGICVEIFDQALPGIGGIFISVSTALFALSSILGWAYYGEVMIKFLSRKPKIWVFLFRIVFIGFVFFGGFFKMNLIWKFSETMNVLMAVPNLIAIFGLSRVITKETKDFFQPRRLAKKGK